MSTQEKVRRRRLMRPESVAVRWMVVLATVIGGLAAAIPSDKRRLGGGATARTTHHPLWMVQAR
jgi:hypothetical protein